MMIIISVALNQTVLPEPIGKCGRCQAISSSAGFNRFDNVRFADTRLQHVIYRRLRNQLFSFSLMRVVAKTMDIIKLGVVHLLPLLRSQQEFLKEITRLCRLGAFLVGC